MTAATPSASAAADEGGPLATRRQPQAAAPRGELQIPHVPHMLVQRIDALPEEAMEQVLTALGRLDAPAASSSQRPGWLHFLGWGSSGASGDENQTPSKAQLRELLQRRRREELAADADTADYSSEPFDSIPRQVQLQWRVYAKLYPDEAAASEKLASLLSSSRDNPVHPQIGLEHQQRGGRSTLFGALPAASELQRTLQGLTQAPQASAPAPSVVTAGMPRGGSKAAAAPKPIPGGGGSRPRPGRDFSVSAVATDAANRSDPTLQQLSRSLDRWYELHWEETRALRRGRKARLLAVRGVGIPAEWSASLRPATHSPATTSPARGDGFPRKALRWCGGAARAAAGAAGLGCRPQVWDVVTANGGQSKWQQQQEAVQGRVRAARGPGGHESGRGLAAAQAAVLRLNFTLRKATLVPPDWL